MTVKEVETLEEFHEIINGDTPAVFDFWAAWCGPCRLISPIYEKLASQTPGINFYKVNVDQCEDISQEVGARALPMFAAYRKGEKLGEVIGANPPALEVLITQLK